MTKRKWLDETIGQETDDCITWPYGTTKGYGHLRVEGKMEYAHRYVCIKVNGQPPTKDHEAAHSCGNGHLGCINKRHVSWKTHQQNMADKLAHGTVPFGGRSGKTKLTTDDVQEMRRLEETKSVKEIAAMFGLSYGGVYKILKADRWPHI